MMRRFICALIGIYQKTIRNFAPPCCRFYPSCSDYAREAIKNYGIYKGILKAAVRMSRCHPLSVGGYDPVK